MVIVDAHRASRADLETRLASIERELQAIGNPEDRLEAEQVSLVRIQRRAGEIAEHAERFRREARDAQDAMNRTSQALSTKRGLLRDRDELKAHLAK